MAIVSPNSLLAWTAGIALAMLSFGSPAEPMRWRGDFVYFADSALFTDCASGQRWPVAKEGDYLALEIAYLHWRGAPKAPLLANFDGRVEVRESMEGPPREHMVVDRLVSVQPGSSCETLRADQARAGPARLQDTYWKLVEIGGQAVAPMPGQQREVRITLAGEGARLSGFSGCNQLIGSYDAEGTKLRFHPTGTMMACEPPLMELEQRVHAALAGTTGYRIEGQRLTLLDGDGKALAGFDAVYLR
jgi:heat shock protein HslJ